MKSKSSFPISARRLWPVGAAFSLAWASVLTAAPLIIPASTSDQSFMDTTGNDEGDAPGSIRAVEARVGENEPDSHEVRYCVAFPISQGDRKAILEASDRAGAVMLNVFLRSKLNTSGGAVAVAGFTDHEGDSFTAPQFHSSKVTVLEESAVTDSTQSGQMIEIDVTDFAKERAKSGADALAFRLQYLPEAPNEDGRINRFQFDTADGEAPPYVEVFGK